MNLVPSKMQRGHLRGFTLIELLVVIAIIGILSAVVLASLNTARSKGSDAAIKSNLTTIQTQAALDYDGNLSSYGMAASTTLSVATTTGTGTPGSSALFNDPNVTSALNAAYNAAGANNVQYAAASTFFIVEAKTPAAGGWWCVDSIGASKQEATSTPFPGLATMTFPCP
jgi:prepilin-type N-terminal cleavage/methylation domain-containing protein